MDRIKVERAIDGLAEWQKHVQTNSDIDRDISTAIEALKAQLSCEGTIKGTTSDLINRTETVEHLRRMLESTVPNTDYDEGFIDGIEFGISTVSTMPPAQYVATDTNVGDTISRQAVIDGKIIIQRTNGVEIYYDEAVPVGYLKRLPSVQPEPQWIPVGEKLPETEDFVLASLSGKYRNTTFEHACEIADYADGEWCIYAYPNMSAEKCAELIEAWMPLPEPYNGRK